MASPQDLLKDPAWNAKPIEQRERELIAADPQQFGQFPQERRRKILENAAKKNSPRSSPGPPTLAKETIPERIRADLSIGWRQGMANLESSLASVTDIVRATGASKSLRTAAEQNTPSKEEMAGRQSVLDQVIQGVGSAPALAAKYAPAEMAGKYAPLAAGATGFVTNLDKGPGEALKEGLKDATMFGGMAKAAKLPTRTARAIGSAAVAGGTTALFEGGDAKQAASAAIMGGGFGAIGGEKKALTPEQAKGLLEGGVGAVSKVRDTVRKAIAPQNRGPQAREMAHIIRANVGDMQRQSDIADYALREASKSFTLMPDAQRLEIINAIEKGEPQSEVKFRTILGGKTVDAKQMQGFVDTMRKLHNDVRDELIRESSIRDPKTGELKPTALRGVADALQNPDAAMKSYYTNYFPHLFTKPEEASARMQQFYAGRRPLEGPATFLHQRKHPTIEDALYITDESGAKIPTGLRLVTTDPVESYMLKWREMKRFTAAQKIMKEMGESGLIQWVPAGKKGPAGWVKLDERGMGKAFHWTKDGDTVGYGWAPEQAARVLNNYLSPGLRQFAPVRGMLTFNNVLNQAQLGMSAFHLGFTAVDSITSRFALGLEQMFEGGIKKPDPKMFAKGATNAIKAAVFPVTLAENMRLGRDMRMEWRKPGSSGKPEVANLVAMMQEAGGGMSLDPVYRTNMTHKLTEAIRQQNGFLRTAWRVPFAINEQVGNLIMDKFVPMQKMGVFADLARFELDRLPEGAPRQQVRQAMAKAWDSVDNRMGMLRYDNLFWDKTIKDLAMLTTRSVGWNLGTLREIGGGVTDLSKLKGKELSHRLAYTVSLPFVTGMIGSLIHYAYNGKGPEQLMDYYFPRTGRKDEFNRDERISIPSYIKDLYHIGIGAKDLYQGLGPKKLLSVTGAKMHPMVSLVSDMLANRDFYNTEISHQGDPLIKRATDTLQFIGTQYTPFAWSNIQRERKLGFPASEQALTAIGFTPAPADIKKTTAERLATDIMAERLPKRATTREDRERRDRIADLERRIRTQDQWKESAKQALDEGALSEGDILHAMDRASGLPLDRSFKQLSLEDAIRVYKVASKEERSRLRPIFAEKVQNNVDRITALPAKSRSRLSKEILTILREK